MSDFIDPTAFCYPGIECKLKNASMVMFCEVSALACGPWKSPSYSMCWFSCALTNWTEESECVTKHANTSDFSSETFYAQDGMVELIHKKECGVSWQECNEPVHGGSVCASCDSGGEGESELYEVQSGSLTQFDCMKQCSSSSSCQGFMYGISPGLAPTKDYKKDRVCQLWKTKPEYAQATEGSFCALYKEGAGTKEFHQESTDWGDTRDTSAWDNTADSDVSAQWELTLTGWPTFTNKYGEYDWKMNSKCYKPTSPFASGEAHQGIYDEYSQRGGELLGYKETLPTNKSLELRKQFDNTNYMSKFGTFDYELVTVAWPTKGAITGLPYPVGGKDRLEVERTCQNHCKKANDTLGYPCKGYEFTYNTAARWAERTAGSPRCAIWRTEPVPWKVGNSCFLKKTHMGTPRSCTLTSSNCEIKNLNDALVTNITKATRYRYHADHEMEVRCSATTTKRGGNDCGASNKCLFSLVVGSGIALGSGDNTCFGWAQEVQQELAGNYTAVTFGHAYKSSTYFDYHIIHGRDKKAWTNGTSLWLKYSFDRYDWDQKFADHPSVVLISFGFNNEYGSFSEYEAANHTAVLEKLVDNAKGVVQRFNDVGSKCIIVVGFYPNNYYSEQYTDWHTRLHNSEATYKSGVTGGVTLSSGVTLKYIGLLNANAAATSTLEWKMTGGYDPAMSNSNYYPNKLGHRFITTEIRKERSCWDTMANPNP